ncbi:MAG: hypothetical protein ACK5P6_00045 [Pseudobdellovibrionaceae bacterium]
MFKLVQDNQTEEPQQLELKKKNIPWARLLARVFNIDVETCTKCGGKMKIIAAIDMCIQNSEKLRRQIKCTLQNSKTTKNHCQPKHPEARFQQELRQR